MKTFFDASVLVPLLNLESPHHVQAAAFWTAAQERATSAHALAESFRTLTSLKRPVPPRVAREAVAQLVPKMELVAGTPDLYLEALQRMADLGHSGPGVYDALHCVAAQRCRADKIVTRNKKHFDLFAGGITVEALA